MTFEPKICPCYSNTGIARLRSDHQVWYYDYVTTQVKQHPRLLHASTQHTLSPCLLHGSRTALALALALLLAVATLALATLGLRAGAPGHLVSPPLSLPLVSPRHCIPLTCITTSTILIIYKNSELQPNSLFSDPPFHTLGTRDTEVFLQHAPCTSKLISLQVLDGIPASVKSGGVTRQNAHLQTIPVLF